LLEDIQTKLVQTLAGYNFSELANQSFDQIEMSMLKKQTNDKGRERYE
jgi:hypothetical protein